MYKENQYTGPLLKTLHLKTFYVPMETTYDDYTKGGKDVVRHKGIRPTHLS